MSPGVDCRVFIFKVIEDGSGAISDSKFQLRSRNAALYEFTSKVIFPR